MSPKHDDLTFAKWRKSSYSGGNGGDCVEVAELTETVHIRDSKDTFGPVLTFAPDAWAAFVDFARRQAG